MADIQRIRVPLVIPAGGEGVATFYAAAADTTAVAALGVFWNAIKSLFPGGFSYQVQGTGDLIDEENGHITGLWTQSGGSTGSSAATGASYFAGTGARVRWHTGGIVHFRRVVGSTFLCPLNQASADTDGTILDTTVAAIQSAANTLVTNSNLLIWSPPVTAAQATPTVPERVGSSHVVVAAIAQQKVASLRSRRV